jgi:hypothetical protein
MRIYELILMIPIDIVFQKFYPLYPDAELVCKTNLSAYRDLTHHPDT